MARRGKLVLQAASDRSRGGPPPRPPRLAVVQERTRDAGSAPPFGRGDGPRRRASRSGGSTARARSRLRRCAGRLSCSTSGPRGASRARRRRRAPKRLAATTATVSRRSSGSTRMDAVGDAASLRRPVRPQLSARLRRAGEDGGPLRGHGLPGDVVCHPDGKLVGERVQGPGDRGAAREKIEEALAAS